MQVIFFEHVLLYNLKGTVGGKDEVACLEKSELVREGKDCVIFTYSRMRWTVMQAAAQLEKEVRSLLPAAVSSWSASLSFIVAQSAYRNELEL
jgi:pyruvate/2-oxoglutarate/acetoin dehydrogenase E1 component